MRAISKFSKIMKVIYPRNCSSQTCDYWLITQNQQAICIENSGQLQNRRQLQNNTGNGAMSIAINRVINLIISSIQTNLFPGYVC